MTTNSDYFQSIRYVALWMQLHPGRGERFNISDELDDIMCVLTHDLNGIPPYRPGDIIFLNDGPAPLGFRSGVRTEDVYYSHYQVFYSYPGYVKVKRLTKPPTI